MSDYGNPTCDASRRRDWHSAGNQHGTASSYFKDCEFAQTTVSELWSAGQHDVRAEMTRPAMRQASDLGHGLCLYEATAG